MNNPIDVYARRIVEWWRRLGDERRRMRHYEYIQQALDEALEHDSDDSRYWLYGYPRKWWDDPETVKWIRGQDKRGYLK